MQSRDANLLAALALGIADRIRETIEAGAEHGAMASAALNTVGFFPGESIDALSRTLKLSHSGTVRLVDRLAEEGLIERKRGTDGRSVVLTLTRTGKKAFERLKAKRRLAVSELIEVLSAAERAQLTHLSEKLLATLTVDRESGDFICRFCEIESCPEDRCPVHRKVLSTEATP
jgi:MarR family transcriptional regulator, negative regulator of the multidrug operon emrRAB